MVPPILPGHFELKHSLINMMTSDQFFRLEKDNPHDHIRWFNKITSTIKYKDVPNSVIKLMLFLFPLARAARRWLEKEAPHSILTWEDLVSKFINEFVPPSRTKNLRNKISNFQQRFDESFHEAWDRYKDLLRACHHHGFTELHQLDTFYNALNPADQDSLNSAAGGNLLERRTQDVLTIIENKSKAHNSRNKTIVSQVKLSDANSSSSSEIAKLTHAVNQQTSAVTTAMTAILTQFQATPPPASVKSVEEICVTCGDAHPYYQFVPLSELEKIIKMNEINIKSMQTQINNVKNKLRNEMKTSIQASMSNQTNELKNMMASFFQMNTASTLGSGPLPSNTIANSKGELKAITTRSGLVLDGPSVPMPPLFINPEEDEQVEETLTDPDLAEYTIKAHLLLSKKLKLLLKETLLSNKEKLLELANTPLNKNCSAVILKKLPEKLGDSRKFLIPCGFSELKCKALADLGASINLMPLSFTFPTDFVIVDYDCDPRVSFILGRPFLRIARALIDDYGEEMILRDGDERLTLNMRHDTSSYSNQPQKESINMINIYDDSCEDYLEDLFATNHLSGNPTFSSHTDLTSPEVINPLSSSTTSSSPEHLLEEFADELALITFPLGYDDLPFDIESDLREIEYLLNHDPTKELDSIFKDSVDEGNLADPKNDLVDTIPEMFTDEHTIDYSSPPLYDDFDDDLVELEFDNDDVYDDPFDSKEDKIKESKLLIDELDPPRSSDFLPFPEYDSFLFEDFSKVDALPSTDNKDKVFNPGILIHDNPFEVTVQVAPDKNEKKISISHAFLILENFNPPFYELPFHKEVPGSETLLSFSSENEEKVFKPRILTSKGVHTSLLPKLSHRGPKAFKVIKIFESPMEIFPCSYGEDICILDVPCLHFYPP
nr:reverse transcriptase domain-containing protein [Tanacetum cinerariifolium]